MGRHLWIGLTLLALAVAVPSALAQTTDETLERSLGLPASRETGVEIRVWLLSNARVNPLYRLVKTEAGVNAERFAVADVIHEGEAGFSAREARRETEMNRRLLAKERCSGKIVETPDHLWCRVAIRADGHWAVTFEDLLPAELWKLGAQGEPTCGSSLVVLDGETVQIDLIERGRRHRVAYTNPDICCNTVACAIVDHARSVIRNIG